MRPTGCWTWDFLPDIKRILKMVPAKRQTLLFSATMPPPIAALTKEMLHNPLMIDLGRRSLPAVGITQAVYPVKQDLKKDLLLALLDRGEMAQALVFTRTKHRANRLAEQLVKRGNQGGADSWKPLAESAHSGAGGIQERALQGSRRN